MSRPEPIGYVNCKNKYVSSLEIVYKKSKV